MPRSLRRLCFSVLTLLAGGSQAHAQPADWPHVRGPGIDGHSPVTGLAESWPAQGPPILWERELGQGYSGVVVAGGQAFTQYQTRTGQFVTALDPETGAEMWRTRVDWPWQPAGAYPGPYATPTWHAGRVYYATPTGLVGCLEAGNGVTVWEVDVRKRFGSKGTEFGYASTPLVEDGRVILPVGGPGASVVALNVADGSTLWASGDDPASYCPAFPITLNGRRIVVAFLQNSLAAHDPATGQRLWRQRLSDHYDEHSAWPLFAGSDLLIAGPFRTGSRLFRFETSGESLAAREVWASRSLSCDVCSCVLVGGHVYGFDLQQLQASTHRPSRGRFKCLDFATGTVKWETDAVGQGPVVAADGKLILLDETGHLILLRADPSAYRELGRVKVLEGRGMCWTPPAVWGDHVFVRNHERAACIYLGSPGKLDPGRERVTLRPASRFDWSRLLTREPEFPNDAPSAAEVGRWFAWCCLGVFGGAAILAGLVGAAVRVGGARRPTTWVRGTFVLGAIVLGLVGTSLFSEWADSFVLTWPAALYAAFRATFGFGSWSLAQSWRWRLAARLLLAVFLLSCYGYYRLCLEVGYVVAWAFLAGFFPATPLAVVAARASNRWVRLVADVLGFAVYFWTSGLFPGWKDAIVD